MQHLIPDGTVDIWESTRAAIDLAEAIEAELGPHTCAYWEKEWHRI